MLPTVPKRGDHPDEFLSRSARLCVFPRSIPGAWFASVWFCRVRQLRDRHGDQGWHAGVGPVGDRSADMTTCLQRMEWMVRRVICGLFGHDMLLHFEKHRLSLRCISCAHETTGWTIGEDRSRPHAAAPSRARIETCHAR
jgi:hypothetical protein